MFGFNCSALLKEFRTLPSNLEGGRVSLNFDALPAPWDFRKSIVSILAELRVIAMKKGHLKLYDLYVDDWVSKNYGHKLPRLPAEADLHLLSSNAEVLDKPFPPPRERLCALRGWG